MTRILIVGGTVAGLLAAFREAAKDAGATELKLTQYVDAPIPAIYYDQPQGKQVAQWKQETKGRPRK